MGTSSGAAVREVAGGGARDVVAARARDVVRRTPPTADLPGLLDLADRLDILGIARRELNRRVELVTGLRPGELAVLSAVADGEERPRAVAEVVGQPDAAAAATVEKLVAEGFLGRHRHPRAPSGTDPVLVHVTARGRAAVEQLEGLQVRLADAVLGGLTSDEAGRLGDALGEMAHALGPLRAGSGAGPHTGARPDVYPT